MNRYLIGTRNPLPLRRPVGSIQHKIDPKVLKLKLKLHQYNKNISQKTKRR
jgi:hypothetical protein